MAKETKRALHLISLNHNHATTTERVNMDLGIVEWFYLEAYARFSLGVLGWVNISTCNRIEILLDAPSSIAIDLLVNKWIALSKQDVTTDKFQVISGNKKVIQYLLELSTGLRSVILGDDQILTQVKQSFESSRATSTGLSTLTERAYQCMMRCHKVITGTTKFKNRGTSLAYFAIKYIRTYLSQNPALLDPQILIFGAGNMAEQVVKYLPKFKYRHLYLTNRTISRAANLIRGTKINLVETGYLKGINPDIVISCTEYGYDEMIRHHHPKLLVDFSLRSANIANDSLEILDLETMQQALGKQDEIRHSSIDQVKKIIDEQCTLFKQWTLQWEARTKANEL